MEHPHYGYISDEMHAKFPDRPDIAALMSKSPEQLAADAERNKELYAKSNARDDALHEKYNRNLNPAQFFHGTNAELKPGDRIKPGQPGNWDDQYDSHTMDREHRNVYATTEIADAYRFANHATQQKGGSPHIYSVQFTGHRAWDPEEKKDPDIDPVQGAPIKTSFASKRPLRVAGEVDLDEARKAWNAKQALEDD